MKYYRKFHSRNKDCRNLLANSQIYEKLLKNSPFTHKTTYHLMKGPLPPSIIKMAKKVSDGPKNRSKQADFGTVRH